MFIDHYLYDTDFESSYADDEAMTDIEDNHQHEIALQEIPSLKKQNRGKPPNISIDCDTPHSITINTPRSVIFHDDVNSVQTPASTSVSNIKNMSNRRLLLDKATMSSNGSVLYEDAASFPNVRFWRMLKRKRRKKVNMNRFLEKMNYSYQRSRYQPLLERRYMMTPCSSPKNEYSSQKKSFFNISDIQNIEPVIQPFPDDPMNRMVLVNSHSQSARNSKTSTKRIILDRISKKATTPGIQKVRKNSPAKPHLTSVDEMYNYGILQKKHPNSNPGKYPTQLTLDTGRVAIELHMFNFRTHNQMSEYDYHCSINKYQKYKRKQKKQPYIKQKQIEGKPITRLTVDTFNDDTLPTQSLFASNPSGSGSASSSNSLLPRKKHVVKTRSFFNLLSKNILIMKKKKKIKNKKFTADVANDKDFFSSDDEELKRTNRTSKKKQKRYIEQEQQTTDSDSSGSTSDSDDYVMELPMSNSNKIKRGRRESDKQKVKHLTFEQHKYSTSSMRAEQSNRKPYKKMYKRRINKNVVTPILRIYPQSDRPKTLQDSHSRSHPCLPESSLVMNKPNYKKSVSLLTVNQRKNIGLLKIRANAIEHACSSPSTPSPTQTKITTTTTTTTTVTTFTNGDNKNTSPPVSDTPQQRDKPLSIVTTTATAIPGQYLKKLPLIDLRTTHIHESGDDTRSSNENVDIEGETVAVEKCRILNIGNDPILKYNEIDISQWRTEHVIDYIVDMCNVFEKYRLLIAEHSNINGIQFLCIQTYEDIQHYFGEEIFVAKHMSQTEFDEEIKILLRIVRLLLMQYTGNDESILKMKKLQMQSYIKGSMNMKLMHAR